jgi:hypothetical protein
LKFVQIRGIRRILEQARRNIEKSFFRDIDVAAHVVQQCFPNHLVLKEGGSIRVSNKGWLDERRRG